MAEARSRRSARVVAERPETLEGLARTLERLGFDVRRLAPQEIEAEPPGGGEPAFVDIASAAEAIPALRARGFEPVALGDPARGEDVLEAFRRGARDFLEASPKPEALEACLGRLRLAGSPPFAEMEYRDARGQRVRRALGGPVAKIGRDPTNDVVFDAATVSRFHAEIRREGTGYEIRDLGSRHGTFVDGVRVQESPLADGNEIRLGAPGAPALVFHAAPTPGADTAREPAPSRELRDIASLLDVFLTLKTDLVLDDLLEIVVRQAIEITGADRGMILLSDPEPIPSKSREGGPEGSERDPTRLRPAIARAKGGEPIAEDGIAISRRIPRSVFETGRGEIFEDLLLPGAAEEHPGTIGMGVRSAMCAPLRSRRAETGPEGEREVLGVLYVDSATRKEPFSPRTLQAFESLAVEASQAIWNARLYKVCLEKRRVDDEIRIAQSIQRSLQPAPDFENGWAALRGTSEPSREVGGDFFQYYPLAPDRLALAVGDVSGKGIPAAILSATLDGLAYGLASDPTRISRLEDAAAVLNRYLLLKSAEQNFVSLFFGVLSAGGSLAYVNAGHNPPLLLRADGTVERLLATGTVLGAFEESTYESGRVELRPGDLLLLYSDGLTEAKAPGGERFGGERLLAAAREAASGRPAAVHAAVLARLKEFAGEGPLADDVTLAVLRFR